MTQTLSVEEAGQGTMTIDDPRVLPDIVLPSQLNARHNKQPERRLILAILTDAVSWALDPRPSRMKYEAMEWFYDNKSEPAPFTFLFVCQVLDFDPGIWRARVATQAPSPSRFKIKNLGRAVLHTKLTHLDDL